jgi:hypothetical protein
MESVELPLFLAREEPILGRFTPRELGLVAGSGLLGLLLIVLDPWPLAVTLPLAVAAVGLSLVQACSVHQGHRPAWWLAHWLAFLVGSRTWVWRRSGGSSGEPALAAAFLAVESDDLEPVWLARTPAHWQ